MALATPQTRETGHRTIRPNPDTITSARILARIDALWHGRGGSSQIRCLGNGCPNGEFCSFYGVMSGSRPEEYRVTLRHADKATRCTCKAGVWRGWMQTAGCSHSGLIRRWFGLPE